MATNQHRSALFAGLLNTGGASTTTFQANAAASGGFSANWLAFSWNPSESKTLSAVRVFASAIAGTLAGTDLVCDIYSDTAGTGPNASLATTSTVTATPTAGNAAWVEFIGFTLAVTAGTQYWIVLRNANATPATNNLTYRYGAGNSTIGMGLSECAAGKFGSGGVLSSVNSGGAWSASVNAFTNGWRVQFSDSTYDGFPFSNFSTLAAASSSFGKQAVGVQLVVPPNAIWNIRGAALQFTKTGTPGAGVFKLYNGSTLLGTTASIPAGNVTSARMFAALFASTISVQPGTTLNLVLCDTTTADTNTNAYTQNAWTVDNDANSFALMPFEGTARKVVTTDYTVGSPTFTGDQTLLIPFALILDSTGEYAANQAALLVA